MNTDRSHGFEITPEKLSRTIDDLFEVYRDYTFPKWSEALNSRVDVLSVTLPSAQNTISVSRNKDFWAIKDTAPCRATCYGNTIEGGVGVGYMTESGEAEVWTAETTDFENAMFSLIALGNCLSR